VIPWADPSPYNAQIRNDRGEAMKIMRNVWRVCVGVILAAATPMVGAWQEPPWQEPADGIGGPLTQSSVLNAPFSADAITTTRLSFSDGTTLAQSTTARYYRDRIGRARVEFLMNGLAPATTRFERHIRTIVRPDPNTGRIRTLDAETRTVHVLPRFMVAFAAGGAWEFAVPVGGVRFVTFRRAQDILARNLPGDPVNYVEQIESLGTRSIAGVETTGRRVTMTIPAGQWRAAGQWSDKPIELMDERWESKELQLLIAAYFSDSRTGAVEYRLANVRRVEPPPELFVIPADYTVEGTAEVVPDGWISVTRAEIMTAEKLQPRRTQ
jgi:hypothetical protein